MLMEHHLLFCATVSILRGVKLSGQPSRHEVAGFAMHQKRQDTLGTESGFSLLEILVVVAIMGTVAAMAIMVSPSFTQHARAESGIAQATDALRLARETGGWVLPISGACTRPWFARSWDRYLVPKPFSRCVVRFGAPICVPRTSDEAGDETARKEIEAALNAVTWQVDEEARR